ncbi:MAG: hypothetical protein HOM25_09800 [Rhodospirillaceae bacterium]|nr:hypothetical protein [Rhodospirillaceae bacterium]MBT5667539.1 hypothetical protein [Rhodospirillaceae bacterium]
MPAGSPSPGNIARDPLTGKIKLVPPQAEIHVCVDMKQDAACETGSLQSALNEIAPGGVVVLHPGEYRQAAYIRQNGTRLSALPGAALVGVAIGGKAALVITANDVVIEGLACSGISVRDRNGACIRHEGANLTLRRVHFFDSENGILTSKNTGVILIEDSRFENLGKGGQAHGVYIHSGELIIRRSVFISSKDEGHEIKSRAARTIIEDSVVASLGGRDSFLIDIPDGGEAIIRRNLLQEGPASANYHAVAFAAEGDKYENSHITIEDNVILMDRRYSIIVLTKGHVANFERNVVIGDTRIYKFGAVNAACGRSGNVCLPNVAEARKRGPLPLPRIDNLDSLLAETGLLR